MRYWLLAAAMFMLPCCVAAQQPEADSALVRVLTEAVDDGNILKITTANAGLRGRALAMRDGYMRLVGSRVALNDIRRVERRVGAGPVATESALTGLLLGGGLLVAMGLGGSGAGYLDYLPIAALGAAIGGLAGLLLGAADEPDHDPWVVVWPTVAVPDTIPG